MGHTHGVTLSQTTSMPPSAPRPATSVGQVFALVAGFLALAAIGATIGWTLTDTSSGTPSASGSTTPSAPVTHSSTPSPTVTTVQPGEVVPNFTNVSFITARQQLMAKKVQGVPVFNNSGTGGDDVIRTVPAAGSPMFRGETVKLYVNEPAPLLAVPDETSKSCAIAGSDVARVGFRTQYSSGRNGVVLSQNPPATAQDAHWNDTVTLQCGSPTNTPPSSGPSSPPPANSPSPDPSG